eukprot:3640684-Pleurochrysis_carterae.AAC.1
MSGVPPQVPNEESHQGVWQGVLVNSTRTKPVHALLIGKINFTVDSRVENRQAASSFLSKPIMIRYAAKAFVPIRLLALPLPYPRGMQACLIEFSGTILALTTKKNGRCFVSNFQERVKRFDAEGSNSAAKLWAARCTASFLAESHGHLKCSVHLTAQTH